MVSAQFRSFLPILGLALGLALAGCSGDETTPPPRESMASHFVLGSPDQILTTIVDPLPVKSALLMLPDGQTVAAYQIDKERNTYTDTNDYYGSGLGVGVQGGSNGVVSSGIGIGFPLFGGGGADARSHSTTTSTLRFKVPDMAAYRRDWQHWVLHVDLDDGANRRAIETLPPAPPPE
jgi:hypothetical protein